MKKKVFLILLAVVLAISLGILGCTTPAEQEEEEEEEPQPVSVEYASLFFGTTTYVIAAATADIVTEHSDWVTVTAVESPGAVANIKNSVDKDPDEYIFQLGEWEWAQAKTGTGPFEQEYTNIKLICGWYTGMYPLFTLDPEISEPADMVGKSFALTPAVWAGTKLQEEVIKEWGIHDEVTIHYMGLTDSVEALKDGLVDIIVQPGVGYGDVWIPSPSTALLIADRGADVNLLAFDHATVNTVAEELGWYVVNNIYPPGTFGPGHTEPVEGMAARNCNVACLAEADEDIIYEITKTIVENADKYIDYHPAGAVITPENLVSIMPAFSEDDIHPGALKYYEEVGLDEYLPF